MLRLDIKYVAKAVQAAQRSFHTCCTPQIIVVVLSRRYVTPCD